MPPPPLLFFGLGGGSSCGPDGALAGAPVGSTGVSPFTRAAIRLGFSLRRKSGSSASASPTLLLTPPLRWASRTKPSSLSAAESIVWSPFVVIFSPAGPHPSRPARPSSRPGAPPRWRRRRCRRRDQSRALSEALAFVCQASGRLNQWTVRQPPGPRVRLLDLRGEPEEQRLAGGRPDQLDADGQAVDDAEGNRRRRLPVTLTIGVNGVNSPPRRNCSHGSSGSNTQPIGTGSFARPGVSTTSTSFQNPAIRLA